MKTLGKIVQIDEDKDNPLRLIAHEVKKAEFGSADLLRTIRTMQETLSKEDDGVALAAPQIGVSKRLFVIAPGAYEESAKWKPLVFINPVITKVSRKSEERQEGCLSVRWIYGKTKRHLGATIEAYDEQGNKFSFGATGLIAHIFQHEVDHLDGILFIDHGFDFEEYPEEEIRAAAAKAK
jgi:peptide deformylase